LTCCVVAPVVGVFWRRLPFSIRTQLPPHSTPFPYSSPLLCFSVLEGEPFGRTSASKFPPPLVHPILCKAPFSFLVGSPAVPFNLLPPPPLPFFGLGALLINKSLRSGFRLSFGCPVFLPPSRGGATFFWKDFLGVYFSLLVLFVFFDGVFPRSTLCLL